MGDDTAFAIRGEGAWIRGPDGLKTTALRVADPAPLDQMVGAISWTYSGELRRQVAGRMPGLASAVHFRCSAHEYRLVASGHLHVNFYQRLMPWSTMRPDGCCMPKLAVILLVSTVRLYPARHRDGD